MTYNNLVSHTPDTDKIGLESELNQKQLIARFKLNNNIHFASSDLISQKSLLNTNFRNSFYKINNEKDNNLNL